MIRIAGTLREDQYASLIISRSVLFRMRNVSDKTVEKNQNTHFMFNDFIFENRAVYEYCGKMLYNRAGPR